MKRITLLFLSLFFFGCNQSSVKWSNENIDKFLQISRNQNSMIYFYADW